MQYGKHQTHNSIARVLVWATAFKKFLFVKKFILHKRIKSLKTRFIKKTVWMRFLMRSKPHSSNIVDQKIIYETAESESTVANCLRSCLRPCPVNRGAHSNGNIKSRALIRFCTSKNSNSYKWWTLLEAVQIKNILTVLDYDEKTDCLGQYFDHLRWMLRTWII